jgi:16S rRNA (guanine1207-N2)-methyltransferase
VSNPPIRAGKKVTYEIYRGALEHLNDGGSLYIVIRKQQGALSVKSYLEELYGNVTVLAREKGYFILKSTKTIK